jgi:hypothetical protein
MYLPKPFVCGDLNFSYETIKRKHSDLLGCTVGSRTVGSWTVGSVVAGVLNLQEERQDTGFKVSSQASSFAIHFIIAVV